MRIPPAPRWAQTATFKFASFGVSVLALVVAIIAATR